MEQFEDILSFFPANFDNNTDPFGDAFCDMTGLTPSNLQTHKPQPTPAPIPDPEILKVKKEIFEAQPCPPKHALDTFVSLKPAKGRETEYKFNFPKEMNTTPYKYDMRIAKELNIKAIKVKLVYEDGTDLPYVPISANYQLPSNYRNKAPLEVNETTSKSYKEHIIRFSLNVCSFHHRRRRFCVSVSDGERELFRSTPFKTFARRKSSSKSSTRNIAEAVVSYSPRQTPVVAQKLSSKLSYSQFSQSSTHPHAFGAHPMINLKGMSTEERTMFVGQLMMALSPSEQQTVFKFVNHSA